MEIEKSTLIDAFLVKPDVFGDHRGFFMELWNEERFKTEGINIKFKQDNLSKSSKGVLRGLHYQLPRSQGKYVYVIQGEVYDVIVDIRKGSPTFGKSQTYVLNDENKNMLYVPEGFAHGFLVTSQNAIFSYKCTDIYKPEYEYTILWNDPDLNISWPLDMDITLSDKDKNGIPLNEMPQENLPEYTPQ
jgi:dTDP-4-dehydrorhamnose 3,5-epimerase